MHKLQVIGEVVGQFGSIIFIGWLVCHIVKLWLWEYPIIRRPVQTYWAKKRVSKIKSGPCYLEKKDKAIIENVERVGRRVEEAAGYLKHSIVFLVINDTRIFALACWPNIVLISSGTYRKFRNEDELAVILGHEVGHIVIGREHGLRATTPEEHRAVELLADISSSKFTVQA